MKITALKPQKSNRDRVNVYIDGSYLFSLDLSQVISLGVKTGVEYTKEELDDIQEESAFGKLYARALEYSLLRPHSMHELRQYLYRKTRPVRTKTGSIRPGYSAAVAERVFNRVVERGYVDDTHFASYWIENRRLKKGASERLLRSELSAKGVALGIIDAALQDSSRSDQDELKKVVERKCSRYTDKQKFMQYLVRQGFSYDDVKEVLSTWGD